MAEETAFRTQLRIQRQRLSQQYSKFEAILRNNLDENNEVGFGKLDIISIQIIVENMNVIWIRLAANLEDLLRLLIEALGEDEDQIQSVTDRELAANECYSTQIDHVRQTLHKKAAHKQEFDALMNASSAPNIVSQSATFTQKSTTFRFYLPRLPAFLGQDDNVTSFDSWLQCFNDAQEESGQMSDIHYRLSEYMWNGWQYKDNTCSCLY